jgi:predicted O-methyltransferase YrrM
MDPELLGAVRRFVTPEDEVLAAVRARAAQALAVPPPEVGGLLRLIIELRVVRHAVEIGAAGGVSAAYVLDGMAGGMLTSIEVDAHLHGLATAAHDELGNADRVRAILGDPKTVAGRLSDGQYELVVIQHDPAAVLGLLDTAARLLRPGGLLIVRRLCAGHDTAPTDVLDAVTTDPWVSATVLDLDDGLLLARTNSDR